MKDMTPKFTLSYISVVKSRPSKLKEPKANNSPFGDHSRDVITWVWGQEAYCSSTYYEIVDTVPINSKNNIIISYWKEVSHCSVLSCPCVSCIDNTLSCDKSNLSLLGPHAIPYFGVLKQHNLVLKWPVRDHIFTFPSSLDVANDKVSWSYLMQRTAP